MTNGETGEPSYSLNDEAYFFPKNKIENFREKLGLDQIKNLMENYERVEHGSALFERLRGIKSSISFYQNKVDDFIAYLVGPNKYLDQYAFYHDLRDIMKGKFSLALFQEQFLVFEKEIKGDLYTLTNRALLHLKELGEDEGIVAGMGDSRVSRHYKEVLAFLSKFPREEILEGVVFVSNDPSIKYSVSKHHVQSKSDLIRTGAQILLYVMLLIVLVSMLRMILIRIKGNYFDDSYERSLL